VTKQQKFILGLLSALTITIFAALGCVIFLFAQLSQPKAAAAPAAVSRQSTPPPSPTPSSTPTPTRSETKTPTQTAHPSPTSTRVVTQTLQPTPRPTPINCIDDISDFEASRSLTDEQVQIYLRQTLPLTHLDNCLGIRFISKPSTDHDTFTAGRFLPLFRQISVYGTIDVLQSADELLDTITHEVGHNAHYNIRLDNWELALQWTELHKQNRGFVSDYARTNEFEDFAESYWVYVRNPERLKATSPEKYEFMRQHVFTGQEY